MACGHDTNSTHIPFHAPPMMQRIWNDGALGPRRHGPTRSMEGHPATNECVELAEGNKNAAQHNFSSAGDNPPSPTQMSLQLWEAANCNAMRQHRSHYNIPAEATSL